MTEKKQVTSQVTKHWSLLSAELQSHKILMLRKDHQVSARRDDEYDARDSQIIIVSCVGC